MVKPEYLFGGLEGFEWDAGNTEKLWLRHGVLPVEAEQVLTGTPLLTRDLKHSQEEERVLAYGQTEEGRRLAVIFTVRQGRMRVISARPMNRTERRFYDQAQTRTEANS